MAKKLTEQQIEDRLTMYEEAAQHLAMSVHETKGEKEQSEIVARQIRALADKFHNSVYPITQKSKEN